MVCFQTHQVSTAISNKDFDGAMQLRDPEFREDLQGFYATSQYEIKAKLPHHERMRVAIMQ